MIPDSEVKTSKINTCEGLGSKDLRIMKALEAEDPKAIEDPCTEKTWRRRPWMKKSGR